MVDQQSLSNEFGINEGSFSDNKYFITKDRNTDFDNRKRRADSAVYQYLKILEDEEKKLPPLSSWDKHQQQLNRLNMKEYVAMFFSSKEVLSELKNISFEDNLQRQQVEWMKHQKDQGSDPFYKNENNPDISYYGQRRLPTAAKMNILDYWEPSPRKTIRQVFDDYARRFEKPSQFGGSFSEIPFVPEQYKFLILKRHHAYISHLEGNEYLNRFLETVASYLLPSGHFEEDIDTPAYRAKYPERFVTNI